MSAVSWHKTTNIAPEYISQRKLDDIFSFVDNNSNEASRTTTFGVSAPISISVQHSKREVLSKSTLAKRVTRLLDPLGPCDLDALEGYQNGIYLLIRFPFFSGQVRPKSATDKEWSNTVWWQGHYHGIKIYACGNKENLTNGPRVNATDYLWDPSGNDSVRQFFSAEVDLERERFISLHTSPQSLFDNLYSFLNDGTRRGEREGLYSCWRDMLLRVDWVFHDQNCISVFGSPVWTAKTTLPGYGWYRLCPVAEYASSYYFAEWVDGHWTNRICQIGSGTKRDGVYRTHSLEHIVRCTERTRLRRDNVLVRTSSVSIATPNQSLIDALKSQKEPSGLTHLRSCIVTDKEWQRLLQTNSGDQAS